MASSDRDRIDTIVVEGKSPFPLDMLRLDCCYPIAEVDSWAMKAAVGVESVTPLRVGLYLRSASRKPSVDRWASFGWRVMCAYSDRGEDIRLT